MSITQKLRDRVVFEEQVTTQNDYTGDTATTWQTRTINGVTNIPASVRNGPGRDPITGGARHPDAAATILLRYDAAITTALRVTHDGRTFSISSIEPDPTHRRRIMLICSGIGDGT